MTAPLSKQNMMWLTPPAPAAIAIVRCSVGLSVLDRKLPVVGRARFAHLCDDTGRVIDEVVCVRTNEQYIDIHCHGGPGQRQAVAYALASHGYVEENARDAELIDQHWKACAQIAHPAAAEWVLNKKLPPFDQSLLFREPIVLITGPSNAGKSTLLNAWCGHGRALVSNIPGTTRDLIAARAQIDGWNCRLLDSAGLRETTDELESAGQKLVAQARAYADIVISVTPCTEKTEMINDTDIVVSSKIDQKSDDAKTIGLPWSAPAFTTAGKSEEMLKVLGEAVLSALRIK